MEGKAETRKRPVGGSDGKGREQEAGTASTLVDGEIDMPVSYWCDSKLASNRSIT